MSKNTITVFLIMILISCLGWAQIHTEAPKKYIIAGVDVIGLKSFNKKTVVSFSGLFEGRPITIPGSKISDVIKRLWNLQLFSDVNIYVEKVEGKNIYLVIDVEELPKLGNYRISGLNDSKSKEIAKETKIKKGQRISKNFLTNTKTYIVNKYRKKGFSDAKVNIGLTDAKNNTQNMVIRVDLGKKIRIKAISFEGNEKIPGRRLRRAMKKTKRISPLRFYKRSKFIEENYEEDLDKIITYSKNHGFRDARLISDSIYKKGKHLYVDIKVEEGKKYYFGDISFIGNTVFSNKQLRQILNIKKGDPYNGTLLEKRVEDKTNPDARDLTNTYQNNGYLFSKVNPVEVAVRNDTIDFEIRVVEGKPAYFNNIFVEGNSRTNDNVIFRNLRTLPGQLYSKQSVIRTVRELGQLNYFDAAKIAPKYENVDPNNGTLDLRYSLEEKTSSSQIQLQAGYGGGSFIGTLAFSFFNFSMKDIFNLKEYKPVPMGDGQTFSIKAQASQFYRIYSVSFAEPWLGGKKPIGFSTSLSYSTNYLIGRDRYSVDKNRYFDLYGLSVGLSKRLRIPDDFFTMYHGLSINHYNLHDYNSGLFTFGNGQSNSISYTFNLGRNSSGPNPIYPTSGSNFLASLKLSPPYSLFNNVDYADLGNKESYKLKDSQGFYIKDREKTIGPIDPNTKRRFHERIRVNSFEEASPDQSKIDQEKYRWLEFYKFKFTADWYHALIDKLVLRVSANFGILGAYNNDRGIIPFERFYVGGTGLVSGTLQGNENIALRGYPDRSISGRNGSSVFNKFTMELRYPVTLKPSATIYGLVFLEGGNSYEKEAEFNPFYMKKSMGLGLRIFMSAFGLLGIDFAYGVDPIGATGERSGWRTHFIIGQNL